MPIRRGESVTEDLLQEVEKKEEEPKTRGLKLDILEDLENMEEPIPMAEPEPIPVAKSEPKPEPIPMAKPKPSPTAKSEPEPIPVAKPRHRREEKPIHLYEEEPVNVSHIRTKASGPKPTGKMAQRDLDLKNMSTGMLSEMAGRKLVSEEKVKKKNRLIKWLTIAVLAIGSLGGYYIYKEQTKQTDVAKEMETIEAQKKALEEKLADLEKSEDYLKEEIDRYMSDKAYNRAIQVANRIHSEYPNSETDKYAQKKAEEARSALEKLGIPETSGDETVEVHYEDFKSVSYDKLASNSKNYRGQKVKIYGKILQMEDGKDSNITVVRIAVDDDLSKQVVAQYEKSKSIRVSEGDYVNLGGIVVPDLTFKTALGKTTLPAMSAVYVDKIVD